MNQDAQTLEQKIAALPGAKVAPEQIDALKASMTFQHHHFPGTTSTVVLATLPNGFVAGIGYSACVDPNNFRPEIGLEIAKKDAIAKAGAELWKLEGYSLAKHLASEAA